MRLLLAPVQCADVSKEVDFWGTRPAGFDVSAANPYVANDVGLLEGGGRRIVVSIFTSNHFGTTASLEDAIGRVAEQVANYFQYR